MVAQRFDNIFEFVPKFAPRTYYTRSIVMLHGQLLLVKIYLPATVIEVMPVPTILMCFNQLKVCFPTDAPPLFWILKIKPG